MRQRRITPLLPDVRSLGGSKLGQNAVSATWRLGGKALVIDVNLGKAPVRFPDSAPSMNDMGEKLETLYVFRADRQRRELLPGSIRVRLGGST